MTDSYLQLEPDAGMRAEIEDGLARGREGVREAPGIIGWIVEKAVNFASRAVDKVFAPHPLSEVDLVLKHDRIRIKLGLVHMVSEMAVDPTEAYIFAAKFRDAKDALSR